MSLVRCLAGLLLAACAACAAPQSARIVESAGGGELQVAWREYVPPAGRPPVTLLAMVHVAEPEFFAAAQGRLDAVPVVRDLREKRMMKALILWWDEKQWPLAREALKKAGRADLIGRRPECLVPHESGDTHGRRFAAERPARPGAPRAGASPRTTESRRPGQRRRGR